AAKAKASPPPRSKPVQPTKPVQTAAAKPVTKTVPAPLAAAPQVTANGAWRIQLGAFAQRGSAEALFQRLAARLSGKRPFYIPAGNVTRLQVRPFESKTAAAAACRAVATACFPVPAK